MLVLNKSQLLTTLVTILLLFVTGTASASYYEPNKTPENVQKKAVIIKHDAKLFKRKNGPYGKKVEFMQLYFLLKSKSTRQRLYYRKKSHHLRVPVSKQPYTDHPDGWLDTNSFVEWNTLQMIKLEPQSGRKLAKIFEKRHCARLFGKYGRVSRGCQVLGSEPNRFTSDTDFQLLIPVFQKIRRNYEGGFIRVYEQDSTVSAAPASLKRGKTTTYRRSQKHRLGYDIVFVVDSNTSMGEYFLQTKEALQAFIKQIKESVNGQIKEFSLRIGILFYRSRANLLNACNRGYLTKWGQHLTENVNDVIKALASEAKTSCSGEQRYEAVLDGLNRAISSTSWESNHFKSIVLIGDEPPYPVYDRNNPMRLSVYLINKRALKKNIRLITFKLGRDDRDFKRLALDTALKNKGRYYTIPLDNLQKFQENLSTALTDEWRMLTIAQSMLDYKRKTISGKPAQEGVDLRADQDFFKKYNLTQYETLIIQSRLPDTLEENAVLPEFVKGWIPQEIQNQLAVDEFIFMDKFSLKTLINTLGSFAEAALIGSQDGGLAFIRSIRHVLAAQTRMPANRLFRSGETLNSTLEKAKILPFRTDLLTFTAREVNTWKPDDYRRINTILKEKVKVLGEFIGNPKNLHHFGKMPHFYVPRVFFP